jgi:hypothetical protein
VKLNRSIMALTSRPIYICKGNPFFFPCFYYFLVGSCLYFLFQLFSRVSLYWLFLRTDFIVSSFVSFACFAQRYVYRYQKSFLLDQCNNAVSNKAGEGGGNYLVPRKLMRDRNTVEGVPVWTRWLYHANRSTVLVLGSALLQDLNHFWKAGNVLHRNMIQGQVAAIALLTFCRKVIPRCLHLFIKTILMKLWMRVSRSHLNST